MTFDWLAALVQMIVTVILTSILAPIIIQRYSKPKQMRELEISKEYVELVDMSADQLEKRLNYIGKLSDKVESLEGKIDALDVENTSLKHQNETQGRMNKEREIRIQFLESLVASHELQIEKYIKDTDALGQKNREMERRYEELKLFTHDFIAAIENEGIHIPEHIKLGIPATLRMKAIKRNGN